MAKVWLITGANTGFGRAIADAAIAAGDVVVATARSAEAVADFDGHLALDVTDPERIEQAVAEVIEKYGAIDVLVNNAGHGYLGAVEELTDDDLRKVLDTNVFGPLRMCRAVLPQMRGQGGGVIVQMSSVGGVVGNPGHAAYATSKFALEGLSEALAGEVAPFGIRVLIVEPGPFRTEFAGRSIGAATELADYAQTPAGELRRRFPSQDGRQPNDPRRGAEIIVDAVSDSGAPLRLPLGPEAVGRIRTKIGDQLDDLERWAERSTATAFDAGR